MSEPLRDDRGRPARPQLRAALTNDEIDAFGARLPAPVPAEIRELLSFAGGFEFGLLSTDVDFLGTHMFAFEEAFPHGLPLVGDVAGNHWVLDVRPGDGRWGMVFYVCHDPSAVVVQAPSLSVFLAQIFAAGRGEPNPLEYVRKDGLNRILRGASARCVDIKDAPLDPLLKALSLPDGAEIVDLRSGELGTGFSVASVTVQRPTSEPVFLVRREPSRDGGIWRRLFGR